MFDSTKEEAVYDEIKKQMNIRLTDDELAETASRPEPAPEEPLDFDDED